MNIFKQEIGKAFCKLKMRSRDEKWVKANYIFTSLTSPHESKIIKQYGKYYLILHYAKKLSQGEDTGRIVALDPGVRTFQTFYSQETIGEIGCDFNLKLRKMHAKLDRLNEKRKKHKHRKNIKKKVRKMRKKIKNKTSDLHWQAASYLTKNFDTILLPKFSAIEITRKSKNKILNREVYALSHFAFREKLQHAAKMRGKNVILCMEHYTSKTCTLCGSIKDDLGSSKLYNCSNCKSCIPRDINGARNIFIKHITNYVNDLDADKNHEV